MKTKIKDLRHAIELYNQGRLVPMKSVLVDKDGNKRLFLCFTQDLKLLLTNVLTDNNNNAVTYWSNEEIFNIEFHIKPKTETIKIEKWVCVSPELNVFLLDTQPQEHLNHLVIHNKKITLEFEMERDDDE